jgi:N-carbamoylputrescine amidase
MGKRKNRIALGVAQFSMTGDQERNIARACRLVREARARGAGIVLLPELFAHPYFPRRKSRKNLALAESARKSRAVLALRALARELGVVLPVSFYEKRGDSLYNSVAVVDADGSISGIYRKSHLPDGPGYHERFYFEPSDRGFKVFATRQARLGVGICWDQWFPETSRALALLGADLLLFPSAIGSEPTRPGLDTSESWQRVMIGQAVANCVPVAAANRVGKEGGQMFYGSSFIADHRGEKLAEMGRKQQGVIVARLDLGEAGRYRRWFGLLDDRRPELYGIVTRKSRGSAQR